MTRKDEDQSSAIAVQVLAGRVRSFNIEDANVRNDTKTAFVLEKNVEYQSESKMRHWSHQIILRLWRTHHRRIQTEPFVFGHSERKVECFVKSALLLLLPLLISLLFEAPPGELHAHGRPRSPAGRPVPSGVLQLLLVELVPEVLGDVPQIPCIEPEQLDVIQSGEGRGWRRKPVNLWLTKTPSHQFVSSEVPGPQHARAGVAIVHTIRTLHESSRHEEHPHNWIPLVHYLLSKTPDQRIVLSMICILPARIKGWKTIC